MKSARPSAEETTRGNSLFPALALETSTRPGSVALALSQDRLLFRPLPGGGDLASHLLPALDSLAREAGVEPGEVRLVVLGTGPGSFTGLRSGAAAAAVLSAYLPAPLVALSSLEGSPILSSHRRVALCLDALRGQVQGGVFQEGAPLFPPFLADPAEFAARIEGEEGVLAGNAASRVFATGKVPPGWTLLEDADWTPRADLLLRRGLTYARKGAFTPPQDIQLLYLRPSAAAEKKRTPKTENHP